FLLTTLLNLPGWLHWLMISLLVYGVIRLLYAISQELLARWFHRFLKGRVPLHHIRSALGRYHRRFVWMEGQGQLPLPELDTYATDESCLMLRAEVGMGKSTSLLRLFILHKIGFARETKTHFVSLQYTDAGEKIAQILEHNPHAFLLLDHVEHWLARFESFDTGMEALLKLVENCDKLIVSIDTEALPPDWMLKDRTEFIGEEVARDIQLISLLPLSPQQIGRFVRVKRPWRDLGEPEKAFWGNPARLRAWRKAGIETPPSASLATVIGNALQSRSEPDAAVSDRFALLEEMAEMIAVRAHSLISVEDFLSLIDRFEQHDWQWQKDPLLHQDWENMIGFTHQSDYAFCLAWKGVYQHDFQKWDHFAPARQLFRELAWENLFQGERLPTVEGRSRFDRRRKALQAFRWDEIAYINFLYLSEWQSLDLRLLKTMYCLESVHFDGANLQQITESILPLLPPQKVWVHLGLNTATAEVYLLNKEQGRGRQLQAVEFPPNFLPHQHLPKASEKSISRGHQRLLSIFSQSPETITSDEACKWIGEQRNQRGETYDLYECHLGLAELALFNHAEIYQFADRTHHVLYTHLHRSTLLADDVREIVTKLYKVMGEDDSGKGKLDQGDLIQIEDGFWSGRHWYWKKSQSYAYPVSLYMAQPGKVHLLIGGLGIRLAEKV
ncbi:MAG: hypothetical protein AAF206_30225, partial [Bacteroidota bacterium]